MSALLAEVSPAKVVPLTVQDPAFIYLFIQRRTSTQNKITKQRQNDNVRVQSKVPIKVQNVQNIKSQYRMFMSSS